MQITTENQAILSRIIVRSSSYSILQWEKEWEKTRVLLQNISCYPVSKPLEMNRNESNKHFKPVVVVVEKETTNS